MSPRAAHYPAATLVVVAALLASPATAPAASQQGALTATLLPALRGTTAFPPTSLRLPGAPLLLARHAASRTGPSPRSILEFGFKTRDGYRVAVVGFAQTVAIAVTRRHSHSLTAYLARGRVSAAEIRADFAEFGHVAVRFRPSGRVRRTRPPPGCKGPRRIAARYGVFVGDVSFRGEGDYTTAHLHRVRGASINPTPPFTCSPPRGAPKPRTSHPIGTRTGKPGKLKVTTLAADWKQPLAKTFLLAQTGGRIAFFIALADRSEGSIAVIHEALAIAPSLSFASDSPLSSASLAPPAPFSGTGSFQRGPDGAPSWTGSLAVSFPGAPDLSLTGPQFVVELDRSF